MAQVSPFGGRFDPKSSSLNRGSMDEGARLSRLQGSIALLYWNFFNLILILLPMVLPASDFISQNLRYIMFNAVICTVFTWWRLGVPARLIWPIRFVLLLQVWLTICSFLSIVEMSRINDFETSNYFLIMAVIYYFNAAIISYVWHDYRKWLFNVLLVFFGASAFIGVLQFLKVPPALTLAAIYNSTNDIANWGVSASGVTVHGAGSIRAIGLGSWPEWLAFHGMSGWAIIASRLLKRSLLPWEFALASFFLFAAFAAQSRIMYLSLAACTLTFLYLLIKRDPKKGTLYLTIFVGGLLSLFIFAAERMSYVLQTDLSKDTTLQYRQDIAWKQAYNIMEQRPWFGIGPDDGLVWRVRGIIPDKWTQGEYVDNGFLLLLSWGGLPALAIFMPVFITGIMSAWLIVRDKNQTDSRRQNAFVGGLMISFILNNMLLNNGFTNIWMNCIIACVAATALPNSAEQLANLKRIYHIRRPRATLDRDAYRAIED